jgi:tRNA threonylcarbamoyladenosine biosynthesis protein TsaB
MNILALELSTRTGSVAGLRDGELIFEVSFPSERGHISGFFEAASAGLAALGTCGQVAVGLGPGSYSGVRIAISAGLGIALGMKAVLVGIPSILAFPTAELRYRVIGDARRGTYYFAEVQDRECADAPMLLTPDELSTRLAGSSTPTFVSTVLPAFPQAQPAYPSATIIARLASTGRGIVARENLEPLYLRDPHITSPRVRQSP